MQDGRKENDYKFRCSICDGDVFLSRKKKVIVCYRCTVKKEDEEVQEMYAEMRYLPINTLDKKILKELRFAISCGTLKAIRIKGKWAVKQKDYEDYINSNLRKVVRRGMYRTHYLKYSKEEPMKTYTTWYEHIFENPGLFKKYKSLVVEKCGECGYIYVLNGGGKCHNCKNT